MTVEFIGVCSDKDIVEGAIRTVKVKDRVILLIRDDGVLYALEDVCSHDGGELGEGDIIEGQIQCPRHGARFDLASGEATRIPAAASIESFEVKIENGNVFVAVPE